MRQQDSSPNNNNNEEIDIRPFLVVCYFYGVLSSAITVPFNITKLIVSSFTVNSQVILSIFKGGHFKSSLKKITTHIVLLVLKRTCFYSRTPKWIIKNITQFKPILHNLDTSTDTNLFSCTVLDSNPLF